VTRLIAAPDLQLLEPEIVRDFASGRIARLDVAVPHITVRGAFALLHDLGQRPQCTIEVVDGEDLTSAVAKRPGRDLAGPIAAEDDRLAEPGTEPLEAVD